MHKDSRLSIIPAWQGLYGVQPYNPCQAGIIDNNRSHRVIKRRGKAYLRCTQPTSLLIN